MELFRLPEHEVRMACWPLWIAHSFWDWYDSTEALHDEKQLYGGRTMGEHIDQLFCDLRCSKRPGSGGDLRRMMPNVDGVWSLHSYGVRCYGWASGAGSFVVVTGALEAETKRNKKLNDLKRDEVKKFVSDHKLESTVKLGDINAIYPR
ncbi:MAG TPA: hypothetical protein VNR39_18245 [Pseudolabrys sp.]|nr:hypothetical protein [Pseudolabrys sp.]